MSNYHLCNSIAQHVTYGRHFTRHLPIPFNDPVGAPPRNGGHPPGQPSVLAVASTGVGGPGKAQLVRLVAMCSFEAQRNQERMDGTALISGHGQIDPDVRVTASLAADLEQGVQLPPAMQLVVPVRGSGVLRDPAREIH